VRFTAGHALLMGAPFAPLASWDGPKEGAVKQQQPDRSAPWA